MSAFCIYEMILLHIFFCWNFTVPSLTIPYYANICYRAASAGEGSFLFHGPPAKLSIYCPLWPPFKSRGCSFVSSLSYWRLNWQHSSGGVKLGELFQTEGGRPETSSSNYRFYRALEISHHCVHLTQLLDKLLWLPLYVHNTSEMINIISEYLGAFKESKWNNPDIS